ncbi:hypothetical protein [Streptomyces poriticola]|uniref:hypothetical protein n=1 Tax=Streptomyces poriticola TaxID=3120506 RepID=UPI002FCE5663
MPVTGRIEGRQWREFMDYEETPILVRHLATAAANQFACQLGCGNAVRTDSHARAAREHADRLDAKAVSVPQPLGNRLRRTADRFRALADAHDSAAQTAEEAVA